MNHSASRLAAAALTAALLLSPVFSLSAADEAPAEDAAVIAAADDTAEPEAAPEEETAEAAEADIIFLLYHDIAPGGTLRESDNPAWCTTADKLRQDILDLLAMGYSSLSCADYHDGRYEPDEKYFILTFDDGYLSNYLLLPDILEETGAHADVFMCTENTTLSNHFNYAQAKKLEDGGRVTLYSHYNKHQYINELSKEEMLRGVKLSFSYLTRKLGERDLFFAYPNSSFSDETIAALAEYGVTMQFVQSLPPAWFTTDWQAAGVTLRYTVAYDTDMAVAVKEYALLLRGEPILPAETDGETADDASADEETEEPAGTGIPENDEETAAETASGTEEV